MKMFLDEHYIWWWLWWFLWSFWCLDIIMMIMIMMICDTQGAGSGRDWAGMITIFIGWKSSTSPHIIIRIIMDHSLLRNTGTVSVPPSDTSSLELVPPSFTLLEFPTSTTMSPNRAPLLCWGAVTKFLRCPCWCSDHKFILMFRALKVDIHRSTVSKDGFHTKSIFDLYTSCWWRTLGPSSSSALSWLAELSDQVLGIFSVPPHFESMSTQDMKGGWKSSETEHDKWLWQQKVKNDDGNICAGDANDGQQSQHWWGLEHNE